MLATAIMGATASIAWAGNGYVVSAGRGSSAQYVDNGDTITVCDTSRDGHGAIGWIQVQQANGSWNNFPRVYNGKGYDTCTTVTQDVLREGALINITACLVDGRYGTPYNCRSDLFSGA